MTQEILVLGGGPIGLELTTELAAQNQPVTFVDGGPIAARAREAGLPAHESALDTATPSVKCSASTVVAATDCDARNLLLAATAPRAFDAERVVALVNDPERRPAFDDAGIETVCVSRAVARSAVDAVSAEASPEDQAAALTTDDPTHTESDAPAEATPSVDPAVGTDDRARATE